MGAFKVTQLKDLIEKQNHECRLTGRPLTPKTAAADHIVPIDQGGENDIANIQILDSKVNFSKGTMTNDEFVKMCVDVVNHCSDSAKTARAPGSHETQSEYQPAGAIDVNSIYTLEQFMETSGLRRVALDSARRRGLVVRKVGRRCYVYGKDFVDYLQRNSARRKDLVHE